MEGVTQPKVATIDPGMPASLVPTKLAPLMLIGPGVICEIVNKSVYSMEVSHC